MSNIPDTAEPLQWCIAVMKREILDKSTIIVTSRLVVLYSYYHIILYADMVKNWWVSQI